MQSIFHDSTIGNAIDLAVVKLEIIKNPHFVHLSAARSLKHFCRWQHLHNPISDGDPSHYDVAILLTRENLCRVPSSCDTLGLAHVGKVCDPKSSCALIEENGLSTSFTIAHELAHVIGLQHDECSDQRGNSSEQSPSKSIMNQVLNGKSNPWKWSKCSRDNLTDLMDNVRTDCLLDAPQKDLLKVVRQEYFELDTFPLPGELFNPDTQCKLIFGHTSQLCTFMPTCQRLWCVIDGKSGCRTQHMAWADGTPCARNYWCIRGQCVPVTSLEPVDGGWGPWSSFSSCSRPCGGGIAKAIRYCDSPEPKNGGQYCLGDRIKYASCNTHECPGHGVASDASYRERRLLVDPRLAQCSSFDGQSFGMKNLPMPITWVPYYNSSSPCQLYCRAKNSSAFYLLSDKVTDGSPCLPGSDDICVNGHCVPAGCDHILGSQMKRDECGKCGGDGTSCTLVTKSLSLNHLRYGYNYIITIPVNAFNLVITRTSGLGCLALRTDRGKYLLNGKFKVTRYPGKNVPIGYGIELNYSGCNAREKEIIKIDRKLSTRLHVELLSASSLVQSPQIEYSYYI